MYNINILFNDYHNFNENVKNHFNITKDNTDIDWDDFELVLKKITPKRTSNVNIHIFDNIVLPKTVLDMFNKYNVEVTLIIDDTITDYFLLNFYFKYIIIDRLNINFFITGNVEESTLYYVLHKLWSSYKMYHIYDPNIIFLFLPNLNDTTINFLSENLKRLCDNRKNPIPMSFFEYMMRDMLKEKEMPYIPYDIFTDNKNNIILNKNKINIDIEFSRPIKNLNDIDNEVENYINVLNIIYSSIVNTYNCANCAGYNTCQKMNTIFYNNPENCFKSYEKMWNEFKPHIQYFEELPNYTINDLKGNVGLN